MPGVVFFLSAFIKHRLSNNPVNLPGFNQEPIHPRGKAHLPVQGVGAIRTFNKDYLMETPEIILVTLTSGDVALFINSNPVLTKGSSDHDHNISLLAEEIAKSLGAELLAVAMEAPKDIEWTWRHVYELLPCVDLEKARPSTKSSIPVKYWDCYNSEYPTVDTHQFDVDDQRETNGQMYCDLGAIEGRLDDMLSITMEVNTNPLNGIDHVPCAHVHFDNDSLAVSLFKIGDKILVRPETNVGIKQVHANVSGVAETLYWIE